ncbi:hypothetical protein H1235_02575 [Pseudoxanthomonas sp. NC8]|nr:hypothetical protein H1235_02575 [Pseudoxanthomonas sp. NC8]
MLLAGDPVYVGLWYYLAVPAVALGLTALLRARPLFLSGASLAVAITLLAYMCINWRAARPDGLVALGHLFSLPGAAVGLLLAAVPVRRARHPLAALLLGLGGLLGGFLANQLVVCNTVMWCGPFSMDIR